MPGLPLSAQHQQLRSGADSLTVREKGDRINSAVLKHKMLSFRGQKAFLGCKLKLLSEGPFGDQMGGTSIYSDFLWAILCTQAQICGSQKGALQACTEELNSRLSPRFSREPGAVSEAVGGGGRSTCVPSPQAIQPHILAVQT